MMVQIIRERGRVSETEREREGKKNREAARMRKKGENIFFRM